MEVVRQTRQFFVAILLNGTLAKSSYDLRFEKGLAEGAPRENVAVAVAEAYLDGKPSRRGKRLVTAAERNTEFWQSEFLETLPAALYESEALVLVIARYFRQDRISRLDLVTHIAAVAPNAIRRAVRYSGLVLRQASPRWAEVEQLAVAMPEEFAETIRIGQLLRLAHAQHLAIVEELRQELTELSPLELLVYASLYACEHLVPEAFVHDEPEPHATQLTWEAIDDTLIWKLASSPDDAFRLTDSIIGQSLAAHLSPFLFPEPEGTRIRNDLYSAFGELVSATIELNEFMGRSVDAFCYDDSIRFTFVGEWLEIIELDPVARTAWKRDGDKLNRLHHYWFYRAMDAFVASGMATQRIGRPENHEMNRIAFIKAIRTQLQLTEVYGLDDALLTETGLRVDLFQALLSLELMTAFFNKDFMLPFIGYMSESGNWRMSLAQLAIEGLLQPGSHNRFPITWSDRESKIANIRPWTVSAKFPKGHRKAAEAILDFWTNDLRALSARLRDGEPGLNPELHERPMLKMGRYLFQLPWLVAVQNNSTAALNNLRRIGARRAEAREETRRIEHRLARQFEDRGFAVRLNYQPAWAGEDDPGEMDLICARDGKLFVLEIKSSFLRKSLKEIWLHKTVTLRKAGLQLRRKVEAVRAAIESDIGLATSLGLAHQTPAPDIIAWIVDTSIEHDHERFSGYLKVSLEEVLIALRDDRHLLDDPSGLFSSKHARLEEYDDRQVDAPTSLYPHGFSAERFVQIIERAEVWQHEDAL